MQRCRDAEVKKCRVGEVQRCRERCSSAELQRCTDADADVQVYRCTGVQVCSRCVVAEAQKCRSAGVERSRGAEFGGLEVQRCIARCRSAVMQRCTDADADAYVQVC